MLLQFAKPALHDERAQVPAVQVGMALGKRPPHDIPQAPQCARSLCVLASQPSIWSPLQLRNEPVHAPMTQVPARHCEPALAKLQVRPQAPQLFTTCAPIEVPETPVKVFVSQPSTSIPLQSPLPMGQSARPLPHTPIWHSGTLPTGAMQRLPHIMQLRASVARLVSQPLAGLRSQSEKPAMQVKSQVPARHTATAFGGVAQARPQPPQCIVLVCVFTSQPLAADMSQLAKFAAHVPTAHMPALHAGVATLGSIREAQLVPQVPQFAVSIVRSVQMLCAPPPQRF